MNRRVGPRVTPSTRPILGQDAGSRLLRRAHDGRARLRGREVGLEEEVEERRRALEVHEEERRRELDVERHPPADRDQLVERRQDEIEEQVLAVCGRRAVVGGTGVRGEDDRVERADLRKSSFRRPTPSPRR